MTYDMIIYNIKNLISAIKLNGKSSKQWTCQYNLTVAPLNSWVGEIDMNYTRMLRAILNEFWKQCRENVHFNQKHKNQFWYNF